jgi:hypothetical protein
MRLNIVNNLIKFIILFFHSYSFAGVCTDWFKESKIKSADKACLSMCNIYPVDMGTFTCHNECEFFCKKIKCKENLYWKSKMKKGRPHNWDISSEKTKDWLDSEKEDLNKTLQMLPDDFAKVSFDGFYRMEKSAFIVNPGTTSQNKSIALYNNAFQHPLFKLDRVVVHELAHVVHLNFSKNKIESYRNQMGWKNDRGHYFRSGPFLSSDAKESPEEDFAVNIEFFLFENEKIKKQLPKAYSWISKNFSKEFSFKEVCND